MKKSLIISFLLFVSWYGMSQSHKELKKLYLEAKDTSGSQYVILRSGERKEITHLTFPGSIYQTKGKIEYANGESEKYDNGRIIQCQTKEAFYKLAGYMGEGFGHIAWDSALAARTSKGAINVYYLVVSYKEPFKNEFSHASFSFIEIDNNGKLVQLKNDPKVVDYVESLVIKSDRAKKTIEELRKAYGKLAMRYSARSKLVEAVNYYNDDFANRKLTKD